MPKKVATYGKVETQIPVRQRYWRKRSDGVEQRYWKTIKRTKKRIVSARFEFAGSGQELYKAAVLAYNYTPTAEEPFVEVEAKDFLENPQNYSKEGRWLDYEVESA